jgi:hypothetical protein
MRCTWDGREYMNKVEQHDAAVHYCHYQGVSVKEVLGVFESQKLSFKTLIGRFSRKYTAPIPFRPHEICSLKAGEVRRILVLHCLSIAIEETLSAFKHIPPGG